jgi:hypothetical protein
MRDRLSKHARGRGNDDIKRERSEELYFVFVAGLAMAAYETIDIDIPTGFRFPFNRRSETSRALKRMQEAIEASGELPQLLLDQDLGGSPVNAPASGRIDFGATVVGQSQGISPEGFCAPEHPDSGEDGLLQHAWGFLPIYMG